MGGLKPWQAILFVLAVGALGFGVWMSIKTDKPDLADRVYLVDATNGQMFWVSTKKKPLHGLPLENPDTGKRSLVPAYKTDAGEWAVAVRYAEAPLRRQNVTLESTVFDPETGAIKSETTEPKKLANW